MGSEKLERRSRAHEAAATTLAALSDGDLTALLDAADWRVSFHGSESAFLRFRGQRVFAKRMALTRRELDAGPAGSVTADPFGLPSLYQYAVGSAGFAAGRELAAARGTSGWALSGACPHFPILHHARVLPRTAPKLSEQQEAWLARIPTFWSGNAAIIARVDEVTRAPANIVMIQEFVGRDLEAWLQAARPTGAKLAAVHDQWMSAVAFMNKQGLFHFDLHARNLLTDGDDLYLADFGYALGSGFDLSAEERAFLVAHADYDSAYARWAYARWLEAAKRRPPAVRPILARAAPVAAIMDAFLHTLPGTREAPAPGYPTQAVGAALAGLGVALGERQLTV